MLYQCHLGAEGGENSGQFATNIAPADDQQTGRKPLNTKNLVTGQNIFAIDRPTSGTHRTRTGGQHDATGLQTPDQTGSPKSDESRLLNRCPAAKHFDAVTLHQLSQATVKLSDHGILALCSRNKIEGSGAELNTVTGGLIELAQEFGGAVPGLGRNTTAMQTGAAEAIRFDQADPLPLLGSAHRSRVTSRAAPDHRQGEFSHRPPPA